MSEPKPVQLGPLPELSYLGDDVSYGYDANDMREYATEQVLAERERARAELDAAVARERAAEREWCATLCERSRLVRGGNGPNFAFGWQMAIEACAAAIRTQ